MVLIFLYEFPKPQCIFNLPIEFFMPRFFWGGRGSNIMCFLISSVPPRRFLTSVTHVILVLDRLCPPHRLPSLSALHSRFPLRAPGSSRPSVCLCLWCGFHRSVFCHLPGLLHCFHDGVSFGLLYSFSSHFVVLLSPFILSLNSCSY